MGKTAQNPENTYRRFLEFEALTDPPPPIQSTVADLEPITVRLIEDPKALYSVSSFNAITTSAIAFRSARTCATLLNLEIATFWR
jgi:hypothetical protein